MKPAMTVAIGVTCEATRLVAMREARGTREVLRARLGPPCQVHRWAAPMLLESLALWYQQPVRVVLCAESDAISSGLQLSDGFGFGSRTLYYDVAWRRSSGAELRDGSGAFRALRRLCRP